jgi:hypothetical protein
MKKIKANEAFLKEAFTAKLTELKALLKSSKCKVGVKVIGGTIQLVATLPPKPDSQKNKPHQQFISLGIPANLEGLKTAQEESFELGKLIARKTFEWNEKYLGKKNELIQTILLTEIMSTFEDKYFTTRKKTETSKHSCYQFISILNRLIKAGYEIFNQETIDNYMLMATSNSGKEEMAVTVKTTAKMYGLTINAVRPKRNKPKERDIPSDENIEKTYFLFNQYGMNRKYVNGVHIDAWQVAQWCYGMLATYGLRPRELFMNPNIDWWLSPENTDNTWKVHEDTKTGQRYALPLKKEWVLLFDLTNKDTMDLFKDWGNKSSFKEANQAVGNISRWFRRLNLDHQPYDLRHAWAIRAHLLGIPIKAAADNLGHSVEIHTQTYQRWFGLENRKKAIAYAYDKSLAEDDLKDENQRLKLENERLKIELERYRLNSMSY